MLGQRAKWSSVVGEREGEVSLEKVWMCVVVEWRRERTWKDEDAS